MNAWLSEPTLNTNQIGQIEGKPQVSATDEWR